MSQPVNKVKYSEKNNQPQGRSGGKVMQKSNPLGVKRVGNKGKKGGIMRPTKGRMG